MKLPASSAVRPLPLLAALVLCLQPGCGDKSEDGPAATSLPPGTAATTDDPSTTEDPETTETSSSGGMDTEGDFLPNAGDVAGANECDPFNQDCPEGEKCVPYIDTGDTWDANKCVPVTGNGVLGDQCKTDSLTGGTDDCDANHLCWQLVYNDENELIGTCLPFCAGTPGNPQCGEGEACQVTNDGVVTVCVGTCDPLIQDCNLEGIGCYIAGAQDFFACQPISGGYEEDQPCIYTNDCLPGLYCAFGEAVPGCNQNACCTSYCDITDGNACAGKPGTQCVPFFDMPSPLYANLGVCISPI